MKQKFLLKSLLLLCALIVGSGSAWADNVTFNYADFSGQGTSGSGSAMSGATKGDITITGVGYGASGHVKIYANGTFTITPNNGATVTSIVLTAVSGYIKTWSASDNSSITISGNTATWTGTSTSAITLTNTATAQARITSIEVTYTTGGGGSGLDDSDLALTGAPIALNFDLYNNSSAQVINYTTSSTGAVTIADNNYATFAINESAKTITVTPTAVTPSAQTITISQAADATYAIGSVTFTVNITDSTPIPTHTATFSVNGTTTTQDFAEGAAITFPANPADEDGKTFVGWTTSAITGTTNTAPSFVTSATMGSSDVTYYAVFADVTGSTTPANMVINTSTTNFPTAYGTANEFEEYTLNGKKFMIRQGYINGTKLQWRAAGNNNGTGTMYNSDAINKIQSIVLVYASDDANKNFTVNVGTSANPTSGTSITPTVSQNTSEYTFDCSSGSYNYFVMTNGSGAGYLTSITINYLDGTQTISNYCTTVATLSENAIIGINDSYTVDLANNEDEVNLSGATATSGATVQYAVKSSTIDENDYALTNGVLTVDANGVIVIRAYVNADATYNGAEKEVTVTVVDDPVIGYADENEETAYGTPYTVDTYFIEGGAVSLQSGNTAVATVSDLTITPVAVGSVTITINTAATEIWHAGSATFTLNVTAPEGSATAPTTAPLFQETFAESTGGPLSTWGSSEANGTLSTDNDGWTTVSGSGAGGCAKFGTGSAQGSAKTPSITVENGKTYTLSFNAAPWNIDESKMTVSVTGGTINGNASVTSSSNMSIQQWNDFSYNIAASGTTMTIEFSATNNRFFLDDVVVSDPNATIDGPEVTLTMSGYATYCCEYPLDMSKLDKSKARAWYVSGVEGTTVTFAEITGSIKGGTPFILYGTAGEKVQLTYTNSENTISGNKLEGTLAPKYINADEYYGISGSTGKFVKVKAGTVKANKALLPANLVNVSGDAPALDIVFGGEATGMSLTPTLSEGEGVWYDLSGRKLQSKPTAKGIYIMNGKKVIIK